MFGGVVTEPMDKGVCTWIFASLLLLRVVTAEEGDRLNTSLPITTKISSLQLDITSNASCPTGHQRGIAWRFISDGVQSKLKDIVHDLIECSPSLLGKIRQCPVQNCSEIFRQVEIGLFHFSGF